MPRRGPSAGLQRVSGAPLPLALLDFHSSSRSGQAMRPSHPNRFSWRLKARDSRSFKGPAEVSSSRPYRRCKCKTIAIQIIMEILSGTAVSRAGGVAK